MYLCGLTYLGLLHMFSNGRTHFSSQLLDVGERVSLNFTYNAICDQGTSYSAKLNYIQQVAEPRVICVKLGDPIM